MLCRSLKRDQILFFQNNNTTASFYRLNVSKYFIEGNLIPCKI